MTHEQLQDWLDRYIAAWAAHERAPIEGLFTGDAIYRWRPYGGDQHEAHGSDAIVSGWLDEDDPPGSWEARYEPFAIDRDRAVAVGWSRYLASGEELERTFHNVFLMRFAADGRCREFTELYMQEGAS